MIRSAHWLLNLAVCAVVLATTAAPQTNRITLANSAPSVKADAVTESVIDPILKAMTLDQKVGQLFMVSVYGQGLPDSSEAFLRDMQPGAVALFSYSGGNPREVTETVNAWQSVAVQIGQKVPLLVAIDQEGGPVTRLSTGFTPMPWGGALGAMPTEDARRVGKITGEELRAVGINMNLAPVVDVRDQANGQFMERRTLGSDPQIVGSAGSAFVRGLEDAGVIGVLKHFPGHGPASDSHTELPTVTLNQTRVETTELAPFHTAIQNGAEVVMVGHLVYPALDTTPGLPASLSPTIVGKVLRGNLGFQGVAMTDAMDMAAIVSNYTQPVAAVMAIKAGIDLIAAGPHTPTNDQRAMKNAVLDAVKHGDLSEARVDEAVRRILALKASHQLLTWTPLDVGTADQRVNVPAHQAQVDDIYLDTIAFARDRNNRLPLKPGAQRVGVIFPGAFPVVQRECAALDKPTHTFAYTLNPSAAEVADARALSYDVDVVLIFTYNMLDYMGQVDLVNAVRRDKAIVIAMQSPYDIERGIDPAGYVVAFNTYPAAYKATCAVLYGKAPVRGRWVIDGGQ